MSNQSPHQDIRIDSTRDLLLSNYCKAMLLDRYLLDGESFQQLFLRVTSFFADNQEHARRLYFYISNLWFMPATPILSNGGTNRGLPISCFLNEVEDSLHGIVDIWNQNVWLASKGGGIGTYWGAVRSIGEKVSNSGVTSGIVPFLAVQDRLALAISQGNLRRGSTAVYLPISHPEIEEFIEIRRPTGGDPNRKALNLHNAVVISDKFMAAVEDNAMWNLVSPLNKVVVAKVNARELWIRLLLARIETGEPYMIFIDNINHHAPQAYKKNCLTIKTSNLCSEITLTTGRDQFNKNRTAVCCLSSLNLEKFDHWSCNEVFILDIMKFLDNVLQTFIDQAPSSMDSAKYSAYRERSVGLGVMGFHSFLQNKMVPIESVLAKAWNLKIFYLIKQKVDIASYCLGISKGPCPDAQDLNIQERFTHKIAIAPTASISIIAGSVSPGIEPYTSNTYTQKSLTGSFYLRNRSLRKLLIKKAQNTEKIWSSIMHYEGSVAHLSFLTNDEKNVFKTAFEINQEYLIDLASARSSFICQSQSLNLFLLADTGKTDLMMLHYRAWKCGLKSLYYLRSKSSQRVDQGVASKEDNHIIQPNRDECLSCQ